LLFNLANLYKEKGDVEKAEKNYNDSLYFLPYFAQPYLQLGSLYWKRKDEKKAEEYFSIGNSMDSFMPDILPSTEEEKTIGYTRLLKTEKPTPLFYLYHSPAWHISLAINYMKKSELENSRSEIDKAIAVLDKDSPLQSDKMAMVEVYIYKGNIYLIEKNLDKALEENLKAYDIDSSHLGAIANLGMIYFLKEDYDAAVKYCRMALGINPDFYPALILKQALTEKGKM
jgi:tetratricopeptide (TPR) repeat protein